MEISFAGELDEDEVIFERDKVGDICRERLPVLDCADVPAVDEKLCAGGGDLQIEVKAETDITDGRDIKGAAKLKFVVEAEDVAGVIHKLRENTPRRFIELRDTVGGVHVFDREIAPSGVEVYGGKGDHSGDYTTYEQGSDWRAMPSN